ncbi:MAG: 4-vinyl reductase [bacterium]|nr:4-vinyl reductase [bacterium]
MSEIQPKELTREDAQKIMESPGEVRGVSIKPNWEFLFEKQGDKANVLEKEFERVGYPFPFKDIRPMKFYPIGYDMLFFALSKRVLNLSNQDFFDMGVYGAKTSFFLKVALRYFVSPSDVLKQAPSLWKKYYTIGSISVVEEDIQNHRIVFYLLDFSGPYERSFCHNFRAYLATILHLVLGVRTVCEETKCSFEGGSHHEFVITW